MDYRHQFILIFKYGLMFGILQIASNINSQTISRQSISSTGGSISYNGISVQSVVGQSSNTINTIQPQGGLRQGFIQPPAQSAVFAKTLPSVLIYPNPSTGVFHIKMDFESGDHFVVNNILGAKITGKEILSKTNEQNFNLEGNSEGVYIITIFRQSQIIKTTKLVLAK